MKKIKSLSVPAILVAFAVFVLTTLIGCGGGSSDLNLSGQIPVNYSVTSHWLSLPTAIDKPVDVFYLCPTAWQSSDNSVPQICTIDDPTLLKGAQGAYQRQATAFETVGNVFAPYYRQDNDCPTNRESVIDGIPTSDGIAAFNYYINHFNNGRPFILVGHSQGANVLSNLLARYMKTNPVVYKKMIAAYVIGYSVTNEYLAKNPHLKFAGGPDDTGVIISYNTQAPDVTSNPVMYAGVGNVINPITWTREETVATVDQGLGSFMPNSQGVLTPVPQYADARVDKAKGVLICTTADEDLMYKLSGGFGRGVYHSFDIPFYYFNLRENAANRTKIFLAKNKS